MYDLIVVPVDGSDAGAEAVAHAVALAAVHDAAIHIIHVIEPHAGHDADGTDIVAALEEVGNRALEDAATAARTAGIEVAKAGLLRGQPHREIVEYAEESEADLIVMTTQGRTGVGRLLLGSVAEKVVRLSAVPVLTIRPNEEIEE